MNEPHSLKDRVQNPTAEEHCLEKSDIGNTSNARVTRLPMPCFAGTLVRVAGIRDSLEFERG